MASADDQLTSRVPARGVRIRGWCTYLIIHAIVVALSAAGFYQDSQLFFNRDLHRRFDAGDSLFTPLAAIFIPMAFIGPFVTWKMRRAARNSQPLAAMSVVDLGLDLAHWACFYVGIL